MTDEGGRRERMSGRTEEEASEGKEGEAEAGGQVGKHQLPGRDIYPRPLLVIDSCFRNQSPSKLLLAE